MLDRQGPGKVFRDAGTVVTRTITDGTAYGWYRVTITPAAGAGRVDLSEVALFGGGLVGDASSAVLEYRRGLDITTGVHSTRFATAQGKFEREAFASRSADVMVFRYTADTPKTLSGSISLSSG